MRICKYCEEGFIPDHGNSQYCSDSCAQLAKLERQTGSYPVGLDAKKAIMTNYDLFKRLLGENHQGEFDHMALTSMGFDRFGFYRISEVSQIRYHVEEYYFTFTDQTLITICKT